MEITALEMYLLVSLDSFCSFLAALSALLVAAAVVALVLSFDSYTLATRQKGRKVCICLAITALFLLTAATAIPNTKQMAAILVLPKIINSDRAQKIPGRIMDLGMEWVEELRPVKKEGV